MLLLGLAVGMGTELSKEEAKQQKKDKRAKKQKDKKSRILRNLRKEAPVKLDDEGNVAFDEDSLAIKCLTSKTKEYKKMGTMTLNQAKIFVCQTWLAEVARADAYLLENFEIGLLTDDSLEYEERGVGFTGWESDEGPNAKNTVIAFSSVCNNIIPSDHPPYNFNCRGGYVTSDGEQLSHTECRERFERAEIKRSKKVCRKELRNRSANKGKWWTVEQPSTIITA